MKRKLLFILLLTIIIMLDQPHTTTCSLIIPSQVKLGTQKISPKIVVGSDETCTKSIRNNNVKTSSLSQQRLPPTFLIPSQAMSSSILSSPQGSTTTNIILSMTSSSSSFADTSGSADEPKINKNSTNRKNQSRKRDRRRRQNQQQQQQQQQQQTQTQTDTTSNQSLNNKDNESTDTTSLSSSKSNNVTLSSTTLSMRKKTNNSNRRKQKNNKKKKNKRRSVYGNLPDIEWRAIPLEHLREHPHFIPLPPSDTITKIDTMEDARNFRQDSWQWDVLHDGRCTTSQAVAALGLLEPKAGRALGVPKSWLRGGSGAYHRLRRSALRTLQEVNDELCTPPTPEGGSVGSNSNRDVTNNNNNNYNNNNKDRIWINPHNSNKKNKSVYPFAAKYLPQLEAKERQSRRIKAQRYNTTNVGMSVRMNWGNAQEATSVLTALNYFWKKEPNIKVKEVGMCGAGLRLNNITTVDAINGNTITGSSLLVGASPDALLCYPDGTVEALEVKNHCPFVTTSSSWGKRFSPPNKPKHVYTIRDMPFDNPTVPPVYIPQLMMEMFCVGVECESAVMVRQTATSGAAVLRIYRNDEWIDEMIYWLNKFQADHVEKEDEPPTNFFWDDPNPEISSRYEKFVKWTRQLCDTVEVLDIIKHRDIQRVANESHTSLFLD